MMTGLVRLTLPLLLLLSSPQEGNEGVVLLKNGRRITGIIEIHEWGVRVLRPYGLDGRQDCKTSEIRFCNPDGLTIPKDLLDEKDRTAQDRDQERYWEEYRAIEKALEPVIGITRQKLARVRKKEDQLLRKLEYRNDILGFRVRPPKGWRAERDGNLVTFVGAKMSRVPPRIHVQSMSVPGVTFEDLVAAYENGLKSHHGERALSWLRFDPVKKTDQQQWALSFTVVQGDLKVKTRRFLVKKGDRVYILTLFTDLREDERHYELFRVWKDTFVIID